MALTDRGTGIALPASKATQHIFIVYNAAFREYPLTNEQAIGELEEAIEHLGDIQFVAGLMSEETESRLDEWNESIRNVERSLRRNKTTPEDLESQLLLTDVPTIANLIEDSWGALSQIDRELTGLPALQTDPGRVP